MKRNSHKRRSNIDGTIVITFQTGFRIAIFDITQNLKAGKLTHGPIYYPESSNIPKNILQRFQSENLFEN